MPFFSGESAQLARIEATTEQIKAGQEKAAEQAKQTEEVLLQTMADTRRNTVPTLFVMLPSDRGRWPSLLVSGWDEVKDHESANEFVDKRAGLGASAMAGSLAAEAAGILLKSSRQDSFRLHLLCEDCGKPQGKGYPVKQAKEALQKVCCARARACLQAYHKFRKLVSTINDQALPHAHSQMDEYVKNLVDALSRARSAAWITAAVAPTTLPLAASAAGCADLALQVCAVLQADSDGPEASGEKGGEQRAEKQRGMAAFLQKVDKNREWRVNDPAIS